MPVQGRVEGRRGLQNGGELRGAENARGERRKGGSKALGVDVGDRRDVRVDEALAPDADADRGRRVGGRADHGHAPGKAGLLLVQGKSPCGGGRGRAALLRGGLRASLGGPERKKVFVLSVLRTMSCQFVKKKCQAINVFKYN